MPAPGTGVAGRLEFEDGSGVLTGLGLDKTATEANVTEQLPGSVD
jgi:hypothetical protein